METPVYNRQISRFHVLLSAWPFSLIVFALILQICFIHIPLNELSSEKGALGLLVHILIKSWMFTSPIWLICSIYVLTQKNRHSLEVYYWSFIGLAGHLINTILIL